MRFRHGFLIALVVAAFLLTLLLFLPARLVSHWLPPDLVLGNLSGTLWHGAADPVSVKGKSLGAAQWRVLPAQLFHARLGVEASLVNGSDTVQGRMAIGAGGTAEIARLKAKWSLAELPIRALPPGWTGSLQIDAPRLHVVKNALVDARGTVELRDLREPPPSSVAIGSYRVVFDEGSPQGDKLVGRLEDIDGPLQVTGTVTLGSDRSYVIDGLVAARPGAPANMSDRLRYLGQPDAQGRRPFSVAGTY